MNSIQDFKYRWIALVITKEKPHRIQSKFVKTYHWRLYNSVHNFYIASHWHYNSLQKCANGLEIFCRANNIDKISICSHSNYYILTHQTIDKDEHKKVQKVFKQIQDRNKVESIIKLRTNNFIL